MSTMVMCIFSYSIKTKYKFLSLFYVPREHTIKLFKTFIFAAVTCHFKYAYLLTS